MHLNSPTGTAVLDLFSGVGGVAAALVELLLRTAVPVDILHGRHFDVTCARVEKEIFQWVRDGRVWCVVMGTPCTPWSRARTTGSADSPSHLVALKCAHFSRRLLRLCRECGVHVIVENPRSSGLWGWRPFARELKRLRASTVDLHMCAFDAAWFKPTRLCGTVPGLELMGRRCPGGVKHVVLQGLVEDASGKKRWRTSFASAYPAAFSRCLAGVLAAVAPKGALRRATEPALSTWWERRLCRASKQPDPVRCVEVSRLPRKPYLGWESSRSHWCGQAVPEELEVLRAHCRANHATRHPVRGKAAEAGAAGATSRT
jgi:hypothetical protein